MSDHRVDLGPGADQGKKCKPLGAGCNVKLGDTCCAGTCPTTYVGGCCNAPGGPCDVTAPDPNVHCCLGSQCDLGTGKCKAMTCVDNAWGDCSILKQLPCCDPLLKCTQINALIGSICCVPDGTVVKTSQSQLCCHKSTPSGDGTTTCVNSMP